MTHSAADKLQGENNVPLVTIVIPTFNQADYLDEAIRSVLTQDYKNIELIVLNDGSTDGTAELLKKYDGLFYWETQKNMGQARTLNKGWRMSKGSHLSYLSSDDFLLPSAVSMSVAVLCANPEVVLTYCDFNIVDAQSRTLRRKRTPEFSYSDLAVRLICQPGPGVFFRRDSFERAGYWNESLRQTPDFEYWLRLGLQGRFMRVPEILAGYRMHDRSQSFGPVEASRSEEIVKVVATHFLSEKLPPSIVRAKPQALGNAHIISARLNLRSGRYAAALNHMGIAFGIHPAIFLRARTWWLIGSGLFNRLVYNCIGQIGSVFSPRQNNQR